MIGLIPVVYAQSAEGGGSSSGPTMYLFIGIAAVVVILGLVFVIRKLTRRQIMHDDPNLRRVTLLITVPKDLSESEQQVYSQQANPAQRAISMAESLFSYLGGVKAQRWYQSFGKGRTDHFSLEIVAHGGTIGFYAVVPAYMREFMERQLQAQYPSAHIEEIDPIEVIHPTSYVAGAMLKQKTHFVFPLMTYEDMDTDPLSSITNVMSRLQEDESLVVQYVIRSAHPSWHDKARQTISGIQKGKGVGKASSAGVTILKEVFRTFFPEKKDPMGRQDYTPTQTELQIVDRISAKNAKAGFEANVRILSVSKDQARAATLLRNLVESFNQFANYSLGGNGFIRSDPFKKDDIVLSFIHRRYDPSRECIFATDEMASLWHPPHPWIETPNILWLQAKKASVPPDVPTEGLLLGVNVYRGVETPIRILPEDRRRHIYIIGKSGVGKSVLLENMAVQDINAGHGLCVIDPHGDLVNAILKKVPKERAQDVIIFNPSDIERPIGLNMLEADSPDERDFVVQEMIAIFYKLFPPEMIGPIFEHNMRNVMLTLMEGPEGERGTIAEIPRMFTDMAYQKKRVAMVKDPVVRAFWEKEMAKTADFHKSEMLGYIISKVGRFVENAMMRNIIGQEKSGFNLYDIMNSQKILLVNLSKGTTGEVNSSLLGLIIVSKLQMAALRRASLPESERKDFFLYIDEFQNFVTDSIATILSEARKYRLNLVIAHQYISQLVQNNDTKIRDAVFGNAGTTIAFRVGVEDAEYLAKEFEPVFTSFDLVNVEKFTANVKLLIHNTASRPFSMRTVYEKGGNDEIAEALRQLSRLKFGKDRSVVERDILTRTQLGATSPAPTQPPVGGPRL